MRKLGAKSANVGVNAPAKQWEVTTNEVCIYWRSWGGETTEVYMRTQTDVACYTTKQTVPKPTKKFGQENGIYFCCYTKVTQKQISGCVESSCSCPVQLKAQPRTTNFNNVTGAKYSNGVLEEFEGDKMVEDLLDYDYGKAINKKYGQCFRWKGCTPKDGGCPKASKGVTK